jgi:hypothetical protein
MLPSGRYSNVNCQLCEKDLSRPQYHTHDDTMTLFLSLSRQLNCSPTVAVLVMLSVTRCPSTQNGREIFVFVLTVSGVLAGLGNFEF